MQITEGMGLSMHMTQSPGVWVSVCKSLSRGVVQLDQVGETGKVDHGWGAAHQDEGVIARGRKVGLDHLIVDEAAAVLPA